MKESSLVYITLPRHGSQHRIAYYAAVNSQGVKMQTPPRATNSLIEARKKIRQEMIQKYGCKLFYTPIEMAPTVAKKMREKLLQKLVTLIHIRMNQHPNA